MALDAPVLDCSPLDEPTAHITLTLEAPTHAGTIAELTDRAFGPGRFAKTAERLRENSKSLKDLCFVALDGKRVVGSVRLWPIFVVDADEETRTPLAFLGPIVVDEAYRSHRIGRQLIETSVEAAFAKGLSSVLLVGARAFFEPLGFERASDLVLPGPVDPNRLLIRYAPEYVKRAGDKLKGRVVKVL